jgi:DNA-binding transcriptional LysR family regulator
LSFAQFEREVTGERIRDKIAASKKKGMWMGGMVPLGYRVEDRALHIVEGHAEIVRSVFRRYLEAGTVVRLKERLDAENFKLPVRIDGAGRSTGGGQLSRGHIYKILSNLIYVGRIAHKGQVHQGQHQPIVPQDLWDQVQQRLSDRQRTLVTKRTRQASEALLAGKLFDDRGNRMSPSWAKKGSKRWRYYVSQAALQGDRGKAGSIVRVPAPYVEALVAEVVGKQFPVRVVSLADIHDRIDLVTIGRAEIQVQLSEAAEAEAGARTLTVPWTPSSEALLKRARDALAGVEDAENAARGADRLSGVLRVALPATYGVRRIAPLLPAFLDRHPHLKIDLMISDRYENLIAEGAELALRVGEQPDSSYVARKLESARRLFVAAPSYLARRGRPESLGDLAQHDLIGGGPAAPGEQSWAARLNGRAEVVPVEPRVHARSAAGVVSCASLGLGVAVASIWMCAEELASGALAEVLTEYTLDPMTAFLVFPAGQRPSQKARAFAEYLERAVTQSRASSFEAQTRSAPVEDTPRLPRMSALGAILPLPRRPLSG